MIQNMIKEGKIVPSEVTIKLLQKAMLESGNDKFLIDGFPRNEENRAAFELVVSFLFYLVLKILLTYIYYYINNSLNLGRLLLIAANVLVLQTQIEPEFVLFFDCSEEEMEKRLLGRNQVR